MNIIINNHAYSIGVTLFWGSDVVDISSADADEKTFTILEPTGILSFDIISTLTTPFVYGNIVYLDHSEKSKLQNMIDMPMIHGLLSFAMLNGSDIPGYSSNLKPFGDESFSESILVTGIETEIGEEGTVKVKMNFASSDILKFTANIKGISSFDKNNSDAELSSPNSIIRKLFASVGLSDRLDAGSFKVNNGNSIRFINSTNDNLLNSLEYIYRKTFDENFTRTEKCSYMRIRYNHVTRKYEQWTYDDVGGDSLISGCEDDSESFIRDIVTVDSGSPNEPHMGHGTFMFGNSGYGVDSMENYQKIRFNDYNYLNNKFSEHEYEYMDEMLFKTKGMNPKLVTRAEIINRNGDMFKDVDYMTEFSRSKSDGSVYDIITDTVFNSNFYRVESDGSIGRKAGDEIYIQFENSSNSIYSYMEGTYVITAMINRFDSTGDNGSPSFRSIMDVHRPFVAKDSKKRPCPYY